MLLLKRIVLGAALCGALAVQGQTLPRPSPEYVISLPGGQQTKISQYKGKVVALEFMLTTCPHCQATSKVLTKLMKEYGLRGFQPLGVAINPDANIPGFIQTFQVNYPIGTAPRETVYGYLEHSIMSPNLMMPQLVFIDRAGNIRAQYQGTDSFFLDEEKNIKAKVEELLNDGKQQKTEVITKKRTS